MKRRKLLLTVFSGGGTDIVIPTPPSPSYFYNFVYGGSFGSGLIGVNGATVEEKNLIYSQITQ